MEENFGLRKLMEALKLPNPILNYSKLSFSILSKPKDEFEDIRPLLDLAKEIDSERAGENLGREEC